MMNPLSNYEHLHEFSLVYKDGDKALKLYSFPNSYDYAVEQARILSLLHDAGLPIPRIYGVRQIDNENSAIEMEYIESKPFISDEMTDDEYIQVLDKLAKIQAEINSVDASDFNLPLYDKVLKDEIESSPHLSKQIKEKIFELLENLDKGKTNLCHHDYHWGNLLFDGEKFWVVDWDNSPQGDPAADACMTYFYVKRFHPSTANAYIEKYCKYSNIGRDEILAWEPVIAAFQVNINTVDQRNFILDVINEWYENM